MFSETYYAIRSRHDGQYLVARIPNPDNTQSNYLLVFRENFDALTYLNKYAKDLAQQFSLESLSTTQLKGVLQRWGFKGIGLVEEPLEPKIQFLVYE
ncbi:hypothetical protein C7H19_15815 [Aphanothece hegewaldii CCALA 016]|uniref:Uncharacterized protein n=1 Tax=Aphanothece hegewaldii CCALA 016 TaxID=2107694 RepID=A0A2T1LVF6_9CHRO|nr:hypothetical protein [Aphanothece hegewaldii]PSF35702.1 hypothetical protein C7H19_15815 [Aphanothece hegewaldii CCALA 016]